MPSTCSVTPTISCLNPPPLPSTGDSPVSETPAGSHPGGGLRLLLVYDSEAAPKYFTARMTTNVRSSPNDTSLVIRST